MLEDFRLRVFQTVVAAGTFTQAARLLKISQPAVSQNIAELERILGVQLLDRKRGELTLTPEGELFRDYADKILFWYDKANAVFVTKTEAPEQPTLLNIDDNRQAEVSVVDGQICIKLT